MPRVISIDVLLRFMSEKEVAALIVQYKANLFTKRAMREPSDEDREIVAALQKDHSIKRVAKQFGISYTKVASAATRVAAFA